MVNDIQTSKTYPTTKDLQHHKKQQQYSIKNIVKIYTSYRLQLIVYGAVPGWGRVNGPSGMLVTPNSTNASMTATMPLSQYQTDYMQCMHYDRSSP